MASITARIEAMKRQQREFAKQEPVQYEAFGAEYELVKELVANGYNVNAAIRFHNMVVTLAEHRALQVVANERDQWLIAR